MKAFRERERDGDREIEGEEKEEESDMRQRLGEKTDNPLLYAQTLRIHTLHITSSALCVCGRSDFKAIALFAKAP